MKLSDFPDMRGHFDAFGGRFVPEALIPALQELYAEFDRGTELEAEVRARMAELA